MLSLQSLHEELTAPPPLKRRGSVVAVRSGLISARLPQAAIGDLCSVSTNRRRLIQAQVVSFQNDLSNLAPFDSVDGICPGSEIESSGQPPAIEVSDELLGKIVDALGQPRTEQSLTFSKSQRSLESAPPDPLTRLSIADQLETGIASIDGLLSIGYGQRIGLFAGPGIGKSTLLGAIARNAQVDCVVIALVGERGREVKEFITDCLGPEGMKRAVVVVSTSDEPPIRRSLAALTATTIAEHFRDQGKRVLLLVDSLTRMARSLRDVGLAAGEMPLRQGFTPSVYAALPRLIERAGNNDRGSITAIYSVLTANDQESDPLGEEVKSLLDGHIVLDSKVAARGIRPAIDVTRSISRLITKLHSAEYLAKIELISGALSRLDRERDLLLLGGKPDQALRAALAIEPELISFLNQAPREAKSLRNTVATVTALAERL